MATIISGQDLINAGFKQGKWFAPALVAANSILSEGGSQEDALDAVRKFEPGPVMSLHAHGAVPFHLNIDAENDDERDNVANVMTSMNVLMRTPMIKSGAILPDACPAGPIGTIPVGGVIASEAIHPGMHSADICCSMAISIFPNVAPKDLLDAVHTITHFGPGGRDRGQQVRPSDEMIAAFGNHELLKDGIS